MRIPSKLATTYKHMCLLCRACVHTCIHTCVHIYIHTCIHTCAFTTTNVCLVNSTITSFTMHIKLDTLLQYRSRQSYTSSSVASSIPLTWKFMMSIALKSFITRFSVNFCCFLIHTWYFNFLMSSSQELCIAPFYLDTANNL